MTITGASQLAEILRAAVNAHHIYEQHWVIPIVTGSSLGGDLAASALENAYYLQSNRGAGLVFGHCAMDTAERAVSSLTQEFLFRRLTPKAKDQN